MPLHDLNLAVSLHGGQPALTFSTFEGNSPEMWAAAYAASGLAQQETAHPGQRCFRMTDHMPPAMKDSAEAAFRANHLSHAQVFYAVALAFWRGKKFAHLLSILRRFEQGDFSDAELRRLSELHADFATALRRVLKSESQHAELNARGHSLRDHHLALRVLGGNLRPTFCNPEAIEAGRRWHHGRGDSARLKRSALPKLPPQLEAACRTLRTALAEEGRHNLQLTARALTRRLRLADGGAPEAEIIYTKSRRAPVEDGRFTVRFAAAAAPGNRAPHAVLDRLTVSEHAVAELVGAGKSNDEVAAALGLSVHTVRSHLRAIFPKLGVQSRAQLAAGLHDGRPPG